MSDPFNPINAFKDKFIFRTAFTWDKQKILDFLQDVSKNPNTYGVPDAHKGNITLLYQSINGLKYPDGSGYVTPPPPVQLHRTASGLQLNTRISWVFNSKSEIFFTIFDLLGAFLSLIGPAPSNATTKNYFLPLVIVYAKWCIVLSPGGIGDPGSGFAPTVAQITWATKDGTTYPFLGASAKGFKVEINKTDPPAVKKEKRDAQKVWRERVQRTRHQYLSGVLQVPYKSFGTAPELDAAADGGRGGWNFGNCGETHPFLYLLADPALRCSTNGIAINIGHTAKASAYNGSDYWKEGPIKPPCDNCKVLLRWYGLPDFTPYIGRWA